MVASEYRIQSVYFFLLGVDTGHSRTVELPLDSTYIDRAWYAHHFEPSLPVSGPATTQVVLSKPGRAKRALSFTRRPAMDSGFSIGSRTVRP